MDYSVTHFDSFQNFLSRNSRFIICGHDNPDTDSVCSCIALEFLLKKFSKEVFCITYDLVPEHLKAFDYNNILYTVKDKALPENLENYSLIVVDTNDTDNLGLIGGFLVDNVKEIFIIDHHVHKGENPREYILEENATSTCEIIYKLFTRLNISFPVEVSNALYAGIVSDSGSFNYVKTSQTTLRIAHDLVKNGTVPNKIYSLLYEQNSIESLRLQSKVLATLEFHHEYQIAVMYMTSDMLKESGASYNEGSGLINIPLKSRKVKAVIYFKEKKNKVKRVSLRSKGKINVAEIALAFSGGGHKNAAAFALENVSEPFDILKYDIIDRLEKQIARLEAE